MIPWTFQKSNSFFKRTCSIIINSRLFVSFYFVYLYSLRPRQQFLSCRDALDNYEAFGTYIYTEFAVNMVHLHWSVKYMYEERFLSENWDADWTFVVYASRRTCYFTQLLSSCAYCYGNWWAVWSRPGRPTVPSVRLFLNSPCQNNITGFMALHMW